MPIAFRLRAAPPVAPGGRVAAWRDLRVVLCGAGAALCAALSAAEPAAASRLGATALPAPVTATVDSTELPRRGIAPDGRVEVWIDLAHPALALFALQSSATRLAHRHLIHRQQEALAAQLDALGGEELGRVTLVRNALVYALPAASVDAVRRLPGVLSVRPVTHRNRIDPPDPSR